MRFEYLINYNKIIKELIIHKKLGVSVSGIDEVRITKYLYQHCKANNISVSVICQDVTTFHLEAFDITSEDINAVNRSVSITIRIKDGTILKHIKSKYILDFTYNGIAYYDYPKICNGFIEKYSLSKYLNQDVSHETILKMKDFCNASSNQE